MNINKTFIQIAAIDGLISIVLGASGAHILKTRVSPYALELFETGVRYEYYHIFAIALVGIIYYNAKKIWIKSAGILFIIGTVLFSGSLYLLTYAMSNANMNLETILGPITPIGGFCLIIAWILVIISLAGNKSQIN